MEQRRDEWDGLETFFRRGVEILVSDSCEETLRCLRDMSEAERRAIGMRARSRVLAEHTAAHRAAALEGYVLEALTMRRPRARRAPSRRLAALPWPSLASQ